MKLIITESQYNRVIDSYISYLLEPHKAKNSKAFSDTIYWIKDGEIVASVQNSQKFWLTYESWNSISNMFNLSDIETQYFIQIWLDQHYNLGELIPWKIGFGKYR